MIPKKLHYVWLGGKPIPEIYQTYIQGWHDLMPGWEVIRWDETNFDVSQSLYSKQAYEAKQWAFVSDYIRVKILFEHGGIYLDTDEEMVQPLDSFAQHEVFFGMETGCKLQGALFGCTQKNAVIGEILSHYESTAYLSPSGLKNNTVIGSHFATVLHKLYPHFALRDDVQELAPGVVVYPSEYFFPYIYGPLNGPNTYAIHHYAGTWLSKGQRVKLKFNDFIGPKNAKMLSKIKQWFKRSLKR